MNAILEGEPPLIADAPPSMVEALRRAMAKDPEQRFPSAGALAKALMPESVDEGPNAACPPAASLAGYMRDLMPEGERRWSTIVERASTGLPFELETMTDGGDRVSLLAETLPVTLPEAPVSSHSATKGLGSGHSFPGRSMAGAAALSLPAIASSTSPRAASIFAGLVALVMVSYGFAMGGARTSPLTLPSWRRAEPVTACDSLSMAGEPTTIAALSCLALASPAGLGPPPAAAEGPATHPPRTRHWKRHTMSRVGGAPDRHAGAGRPAYASGARIDRGPTRAKSLSRAVAMRNRGGLSIRALGVAVGALGICVAAPALASPTLESCVSAVRCSAAIRCPTAPRSAGRPWHPWTCRHAMASPSTDCMTPLAFSGACWSPIPGPSTPAILQSL